MSNYFQNYFQGKRYKARPGQVTNAWINDGRTVPSDKQLQYHSNLITFLKEKGIPVECFDRPRNRADCRSKIAGMITILSKNGFAEEFSGRTKEE